MWLSGFPNSQASQRLEKWARDACADVLPADSQPQKVIAKDLANSVALYFKTEDEASDACNALRIKDLQYLRRHNGQDYLDEIRARPDRPLEQRVRGRVLGWLWRKVQPFVANAGEQAKLGTNGVTGTLFVSNGQTAYGLFTVNTITRGQGTKTEIKVVPDLDALEKLGVDAASAGLWSTEAAEAMQRV